jgi:hypothetical protein
MLKINENWCMQKGTNGALSWILVNYFVTYSNQLRFVKTCSSLLKRQTC